MPQWLPLSQTEPIASAIHFGQAGTEPAQPLAPPVSDAVRAGRRLAWIAWTIALGIVVLGAIAAHAILLHAGIMIPGWDKPLSVPSPPAHAVQNAVATKLPAFLTLRNVEVETIPIDRESVKVNFKATVVPKEDLYRVDREVPGTPPVKLLQVLQSAGTELSVYGSLEAHHILDDWTLDPPQFEVGFAQFGKPRGAFDAQSYVTGSDEANAVLAQQAANTAEQERITKALEDRRKAEQKVWEEQQARVDAARQAREERDRLALEQQRQIALEQRNKEDEQRQEEEAATRQKLILATLPGTAYIGTISFEDQRQSIRVTFTQQDGFLVRAELNNPDNRKERQIFAGELIFNAKPEEQSGAIYPIKMTSIQQGKDWSRWILDRVYCGPPVSLKLGLSDAGMEGEVDVGYPWAGVVSIRLQREDKPQIPAVPPTPSPTPGPAVSSPTSAPSAIADEEKAAHDLSIAKDYLAFNRYEEARHQLQSVVDNYPATPAADEARKLLKQIADK